MTIITEAGTVRRTAQGWTITTPDKKFTSTVFLAKNGTDIVRASGTVVTSITAEQVAAITAVAKPEAVTKIGVSRMTYNGRGERVRADLAEWEY